MTTPLQIGPYRIVKMIGEGGMGSVFEAVQEPIGRRVALKILLPQHAQNHEALSRFFNEARAVNLIEHPSIVQISDYGHAPDGTAYLVMELLRGEMLSRRLEALNAAGQRLPPLTAALIAAQIADALSAAHDKGIIHRDLKPSNVMLVLDSAVPGGSRAKILDFGIAKLTSASERTATHAIIGTPQYMSPEQCAGSSGVDDRTDVYALGLMLYEMLAGQPPFKAETVLEYMGQHAFAVPPPLAPQAPLAPPELVALVHRLLVKDKQVRPAMRAVGAELARVVSTGSDSHTTVTPLPSHSSDRQTRIVGRMGPSSTLGSSTGQTLRHIWSPRRQAAMAIVATSGILVALLLLLRLRTDPPSSASTTMVPTSSSEAVSNREKKAALSPAGSSVVQARGTESDAPSSNLVGVPDMSTPEKPAVVRNPSNSNRRTIKQPVKYVD